LRRILADLLDLPDQPSGQGLRFGYGPSGKPFLLDDPKLRFNLSHSEDMAVFAVTRAGEVGIDIERRRPMADMDAIARVAFSDAERNALMGCPTDGRETMFYRIWTRKEAHLKAIGTGLSALGNPEAVSIAPGNSAWFQSTLPHIDGYVASLVRPRGAHGLRLWSWPNAIGMRSAERRAKLRLMPASKTVFPHRLESRP
jgi:4'-phosphopantetheinyl transferase